MPTWVPGYKIRRSTNILSYAVRQTNMLLEIAGEQVYLLKRKVRADAPFTVAERRVDTLAKTIRATDVDLNTGCYKYKLWDSVTDSHTVYPDTGVFTATLPISGSTVWEQAIDKYSFIDGRMEYAFDIYQDSLDSDGNPIADAMYMVFNTPPYVRNAKADLVYGTISHLVDMTGMQPIRENELGFAHSLFGFEQWLNPKAKVRGRYKPNAFLIAFPGVLADFKVDEAGLIRESRGSYFSSPPPYGPKLYEHDIIIRPSTGVRYQIISLTPIYIEDILVSQQFQMEELDPRSSTYNVPIVTE